LLTNHCCYVREIKSVTRNKICLDVVTSMAKLDYTETQTDIHVVITVKIYHFSTEQKVTMNE